MKGKTRLDRIIIGIAGRAVALFHRVERAGEPLPDGPVLVTANHPNSLLDPLIVFRAAGRPTRPLAKAPLFEQALLGTILRALGGLPVYRRQDDPTQMHRNEETFAAAISALRAGDAIQIFPEGRSHSEPALAPMRTGAARIALAAEAACDWRLGLKIVPFGITYRHKSLFRGSALAVAGAPFTVERYREQQAADEPAAVRALTDEIGKRIREVTLNLARHEDFDLIETADRLYTRQKGMREWRQREGMAERLPRLQFIARALAWLRAGDPDRHGRLERSVRRYQRALALFGASEADVPPEYAVRTVIGWIVRQVAVFSIGLPFALAGTLLWAPAWFAPRATVRLVKPEFEAVATYKLATGFFVVPLTIAIVAVGGWYAGGAWMAAVSAIVAPLLGVVAIAWHERTARAREDARIFLRVFRNRRAADRLASLRVTLVSEFDAVLDEIGTAPAGAVAAQPAE